MIPWGLCTYGCPTVRDHGKVARDRCVDRVVPRLGRRSCCGFGPSGGVAPPDDALDGAGPARSDLAWDHLDTAPTATTPPIPRGPAGRAKHRAPRTYTSEAPSGHPHQGPQRSAATDSWGRTTTDGADPTGINAAAGIPPNCGARRSPAGQDRQFPRADVTDRPPAGPFCTASGTLRGREAAGRPSAQPIRDFDKPGVVTKNLAVRQEVGNDGVTPRARTTSTRLRSRGDGTAPQQVPAKQTQRQAGGDPDRSAGNAPRRPVPPKTICPVIEVVRWLCKRPAGGFDHRRDGTERWNGSGKADIQRHAGGVRAGPWRATGYGQATGSRRSRPDQRAAVVRSPHRPTSRATVVGSPAPPTDPDDGSGRQPGPTSTPTAATAVPTAATAAAPAAGRRRAAG